MEACACRENAKTAPDALVVSDGLWHMLHITNASDYARNLMDLRKASRRFTDAHRKVHNLALVLLHMHLQACCLSRSLWFQGEGRVCKLRIFLNVRSAFHLRSFDIWHMCAPTPASLCLASSHASRMQACPTHQICCCHRTHCQPRLMSRGAESAGKSADCKAGRDCVNTAVLHVCCRGGKPPP